jgi:hypothetical protein
MDDRRTCIEDGMETVTLTALRQHLFAIADKVLKTQAPIAIAHRGRKLILTPEVPGSRLSRLKRRRFIKGDPALLVTATVGEWHELTSLK